MSLTSIWTLAFSSYCSPVQGRKAGTSAALISSIVLLEANMLIEVHGLHSLIKPVSASCGNTATIVMHTYEQILKKHSFS